MSKKVGRKENSNVTINDMLVAIEQYTKEFNNEKINIKKLAEFSNIERHYWYNRKGIREKIDEINSIEYKEYESYISDKDRKLLKLPDIESIIENNYKSKKKLKIILEAYFNVIQEFYDSACESHKLKKDLNILKNKIIMHEKEIKELKEKKKQYKELYKYYENLYYSKAILSDEKKYREENNIKDKIINIKTKDKRMYSTDDNDLIGLINSIED